MGSRLWRCRRRRRSGWDQLNAAHPHAHCLEWRSARLGNHRRVWIYTPGEAVDPQTLPLAILLDGQFWAESMPVWSPLAALTREGRLPPAVYLLIDAIDNQRRGVELPCHRDFWLAVQEELLPMVRGHAPFSDRPDRTVVAGQSFGGLAAMFAALNWPQRFGCVLSQSGSTGGRIAMAAGWALSANVCARARRPRPGCASGWAGQREPIIFRANQALLAQLTTTQQTIFWRQVDGGHDAALLARRADGRAYPALAAARIAPLAQRFTTGV
ncbi:enterochelin esterase [Klebsiella quasipneumoniae subsp. similipneumoniae]